MADEPIGDRRLLQRLPGGGFGYVLVDEAVRFEARYLRRERGTLQAEFDVQVQWAGAKHHKGSLSCADLNLSSQAARRSLAKYCAERAKTKPEDFDWVGAIDAACLEIIQAARDGDPIALLDNAPELTHRNYNLFGLEIPADGTSSVIAHGDSLKSLILLLILGTLAKEGQSVLFLDWEWTAARHKARKLRLFGPDRLDHLFYFRCTAPLTTHEETVRRFCDTHQVAMIGVDSAGLACDGKLVDDDVAMRFHRALSSLPPSIVAAHVPKSEIKTEKTTETTGAFGSVFFHNLCRASWLVKKQPGTSENLVTVGLFPHKQNDGARRKAVGLEFVFADDQIDVRRVDLADVDGLSQQLSLRERVYALLRKGPLSYAEIAAQLDAKVESIFKVVQRGKSFQKVESADGITRIALATRRLA